MNTQTLVLAILSSVCLFAAVALGLWRFGPIWNRLSEWQMGSLTARYARLYPDASWLAYFFHGWGILLFTTVTVLGIGLGMMPIALVTVAGAYIAPRYILHYLVRRRERLLRDQMVLASRALANGMKAGLSLAQALESACDEVPEPLVSELRRIVYEFHRGRPLADALEEIRRKLDLESFTLFALAIQVSLERGGRINDVLERIGGSLQEYQRLERKLEADTSSGNQVVLILAAFPFMLMIFFYFLDRHAGALLFTTLIGQIVVAAVGLLVFTGVRWANAIMRIDL